MRVYIAAPYTTPDPKTNIIVAMEAATLLIDAGYNPFVPHLFHFLNKHKPQNYETWMRIDLDWLKAAHVLLRLPGESPGADREVRLAEEYEISTFFMTAKEFVSENNRQFLKCLKGYECTS